MIPAGYLRSKIASPILHDHVLDRARLLADLELSAGMVLLLSAPAGYGKTTLAAQALAMTDCRIAWLSIDSLDNDPVRFWSHVAAALIDDEQELASVLARLGPQSVESIVDQLLRVVESSEGLVVLALDDVHEIVEPEILGTLGRIITIPPQNLALLISTRSDPPIPIGRVRAHGRLLEFRQPDLAFTVAEAVALLPTETDVDAVGAIVDSTEGWVTGLRLLAMSARPGRSATELLEAAIASTPGLAEFLAEEVLESQMPLVRRFLIETSLLDELDAQACDAITGRPGSLATLRNLAKRQVFTQVVDPPSNTFRYHPLFRDFLRLKALELPETRFRDLHSSAAGWYRAQGNPTPVIIHAVAAGDHRLAAETIRTAWLDFAQAGRIATVSCWLDTYGQDGWMAESDLRLVAAWAALNDHRFDDVATLVAGLEDESESDLAAQAHALLSHRARHLGDLATAMRAAAAARLALAGDLDLMASSPALATCGVAEVLSGNDAAEELTEAVRIGQLHHIDSSIVTGYSYLALLASHDRERHAEAEALADQALALTVSPQRERFHQPAVAHLVKAITARSSGRVADATASAERALHIAEAACEPLVALLVWCELARLAHLRGDDVATRSHLRNAERQIPAEGGAHLANVVRLTRNATRFAAAPTIERVAGSVALTDREWTIVRLLASGLARRELAGQLFISENTVKTHLRSIRAKLGIDGRSDVAARARELGLLNDDVPAG